MGVSYSSVEKQSVYSTAPADWIREVRRDLEVENVRLRQGDEKKKKGRVSMQDQRRLNHKVKRYRGE